MANIKKVSLSWLVVFTRDYKKEYDWFWDKKNHCSYGILKADRTDNIAADIARHHPNVNQSEAYYEECMLMPELQELDILGAATFLREWCDSNHILYNEDLDQYKEIEFNYWG